MADASVSSACLCSPTSHPGSFRCARHRSPRCRPSSSSSNSSRASQAGSADGSRSGGGGSRAKSRSVLRAHLLRMISPPSSSPRHLRRDFQPRPSRLGLQIAA